MSRLAFLDRLQTIAATATVTSAIWILVGTYVLGREPGESAGTVLNVVHSAPNGRPVASEAPPSGVRLAIPVAGIAANDLTDSFADMRGGRRHEAIDIMAPAGTPVIAAAPGTVEKLFWSDAGGNTIYVRSGDRRTIHYYAHLQGYAPGLAEGGSVERGQVLGAVGSTGNADPAAPHLHFAVLETKPDANWWETATALDPYPLLMPR
jgi:murein DD-endopeptidase MepM/ murein hydrolase activator NlpD